MVRRAFTLIELIFAIVIIGIAVITLPTMNQATSAGIEGNLIQEAIFAGSTELNQVVTANWDEASFEPGAFNAIARVIDDGTCENNSSNTRYRLKIGHINQPLHRRCLNNNATAVSNAVANANISALNDEVKADANLTSPSVTTAGYKQAYTSTIIVTQNVIFGTDTLNTNPNIKRITATIEVANTAVTTLVTYSSNIGEVDFYKRNYQ